MNAPIQAIRAAMESAHAIYAWPQLYAIIIYILTTNTNNRRKYTHTIHEGEFYINPILITTTQYKIIYKVSIKS